MSLRLGEIGQIAITVGDIDRATEFYREVLGLEHLFSAPPKMAFFNCGGIRLMLGEVEGDSGQHASILYYRVPDIEEAFEALSERGAVFEGEPHVVHRTEDSELWLAFLRDSEDNLLALMSEVSTLDSV
jgi:methylmalonyl-CoA/ethylmalonyl-CoA epimerase